MGGLPGPLGILTGPQIVMVQGPIGPIVGPFPPISGILAVNVTNPITANLSLPNPLPVSGGTPQLVTVTNPGSVTVPTPLQVSGIIAVGNAPNNPIPVSAGSPQLVTVTNPSSSSVPVPLQVSGILGISPIPLPVSSATPQLVSVAGGSLGITPIPLPVSGGTPQLVSFPIPLQVSGILGISPIPLPTTVTGVPTVSGVIQSSVLQQASRFNIAIVAGQSLLSNPITPFNPPCLYRSLWAFSASGVLSMGRKVGAITIQEAMNGGQPLASGAAYMFDTLVASGDVINFIYSAGGTMTACRIFEIDNQT